MRVLVTDQVFGGIEIERALLEPLGVEIVEANRPGFSGHLVFPVAGSGWATMPSRC